MVIIISSYQHKILFSEPVTGLITTEMADSRLLQLLSKAPSILRSKKLNLGGVYSHSPSPVPLWIPKLQFLILLIASIRQTDTHKVMCPLPDPGNNKSGLDHVVLGKNQNQEIPLCSIPT